MNRKIPLPIAVAIVSAIVACLVFNAVQAASHEANECPQTFSKDYCYKCHSDTKTLKAMDDKRGVGYGYTLGDKKK